MVKQTKSRKQRLNLSRLAGGAKGSSLKAGSYFAFRGQKLIYVAAKQKGRDSGYISANVDDNDIHTLDGQKSRTQIEDEISELEGGDELRAFTSKNSITKPEKFVVEDRMSKINSFREYHFERTEPLAAEAGPSTDVPSVDGDDDEVETSKKRGPPESMRSDRIAEPEPKAVRTDEPPESKKRTAPTTDEETTEPDPKIRAVDNNVVENDTIIVDREVPQRDSGASGDIVEEVQETHVNMETVDGQVDPVEEKIEETLRGESTEQKQAAGIVDQPTPTEAAAAVDDPQEPSQVPPPEAPPSEEETKISERNQDEVNRVVETTGDAEAAEAVEEQNQVREQETEVQKRAAAEAAAIIAAAEESAEQQLSAGTIVGVSPSTAIAKADANIVAAVDPSVARGTEPAADVTHPMDEADDVPFVDKDKNGNQLMSSDRNGLHDDPMETDAPNATASSANAQAIQEKRFEQNTAMEDKTRETAKEAKETKDARDAEADRVQQQRFGATSGDTRENVEMQEAVKTLDPTQPSQELVNQILTAAAEIPGLISKQGLTEAEHAAKLAQLAFRTAKAEKLQLAKGMNVMRMQAPSPEERLQAQTRAELRKRVEEGTEGEFPIFSPTDSFGEIQGMQQTLSEQIDTMTLKEQQTLLAEIKPWWNEYRTVRTNQAFHDMEMMPTNIITSPVGDVQLGAKIPEGMPQQEEQFLFFMYWAMRTKLQNMEHQVAWRDMFRYSAAMGYNDLSQARINWLITGNKDGDTSTIDYENMPYDIQVSSETPRIEQLKFVDSAHIDTSHRAILGTPTSTGPPPGRNTSPSAAAATTRREYRIVDGKLVALTAETKNLEEQGRATIEGIPSAVSNIPDPRFSERGGKQVKNVRIVTIRNPKFDPKDPNAREFISRGDAPAGPDDKFINAEVPDVGAGAKDIDAAIERAEADRLTASLPFKMYAPIHPQACDRYLGERNYARLALPKERYFKSYTQQPFGADDVDQQFNWNRFVMSTYGPMLYAFVTDARMQRVDPVFDMTTPDAVILEFMELNELISELQRYQSKSADRSSRVGDSAVAQDPIEKHLDDFFSSRDQEEQEKISDANVVMIALPDQEATGGGGGGSDPVVPKPARPGVPRQKVQGQSGRRSLVPNSERAEDDDPSHPLRPRHSSLSEQAPGLNYGVRVSHPSNQVTLGPHDIDHGVRRDMPTQRQLAYAPRGAHNHVNEPRESTRSESRRTEIFRRMNR
jgi:hypothetical protein